MEKQTKRSEKKNFFIFFVAEQLHRIKKKYYLYDPWEMEEKENVDNGKSFAFVINFHDIKTSSYTVQ